MLRLPSLSGSGSRHARARTSASRPLLPKSPARDAFYSRLLETMKGTARRAAAERGRRSSSSLRPNPPHLNLYLAAFTSAGRCSGASGVALRAMGYAEARSDRRRSSRPLSTRFEPRYTADHAGAVRLDRGKMRRRPQRIAESEELLLRVIDAGQSSILEKTFWISGRSTVFCRPGKTRADPRVNKLVAIMDRCSTASRGWCASPPQWRRTRSSRRSANAFHRIADFWDKFATTTVSDLPPCTAARAHERRCGSRMALAAWHRDGESGRRHRLRKRHVE